MTATVLHVDDRAANRYLRRRILEDAGFRVLEAGSIEDAWAFVRSEPIDVVLTDVVLGEGDGYELTRRIKANPTYASIRVIQISAIFTECEHRIRGLDSGADAYVIEPTEASELTAIVRAMARGRRTERLLSSAQAALRESQERFRLMADTTPVMIWAHDAAGKLEFVNRAYCEFFGVTEEEVRGPNWQPLVHPDDEPEYVARFMECLKTGTRFFAEARVRRADGEWRWIASYGAPRFSPDGRILGAVGSSPDVTELKLAAERINDLMRVKDEFLASVAHELRQPITAALAGLKVMEARRSAETGQRARDVLERQLQHMSRLAEDLLQASRIARGEMPLHKRTVDVRHVVERAIETATPLIASREHHVETAVPEQPVLLEADADRLQQVLVNVLSNAAKYTAPGGRIHLGVAPADDAVVLSVRDTGVGLRPEDHSRIFELFTRVAGPEERGFGIGLYVARTLVRQHGGEIDVHSEGPGRGTEFTIRLPIAPVQ